MSNTEPHSFVLLIGGSLCLFFFSCLFLKFAILNGVCITFITSYFLFANWPSCVFLTPARFRRGSSWFAIYFVLKSEDKLTIIVICWAVATIQEMSMNVFCLSISALAVTSFSIHFTNPVNARPNVCFVLGQSLPVKLLFRSLWLNIQSSKGSFESVQEKLNYYALVLLKIKLRKQVFSCCAHKWQQNVLMLLFCWFTCRFIFLNQKTVLFKSFGQRHPLSACLLFKFP